jgi:hypothetical protein
MNEKKCEKKWIEKDIACKLGLHSYKVVDGTMSLIPVTPRSLLCVGDNLTVHRYIFREKCRKCYKKRTNSF